MKVKVSYSRLQKLNFTIAVYFLQIFLFLSNLLILSCIFEVQVFLVYLHCSNSLLTGSIFCYIVLRCLFFIEVFLSLCCFFLNLLLPFMTLCTKNVGDALIKIAVLGISAGTNTCVSNQYQY